MTIVMVKIQNLIWNCEPAQFAVYPSLSNNETFPFGPAHQPRHIVGEDPAPKKSLERKI